MIDLARFKQDSLNDSEDDERQVTISEQAKAEFDLSRAFNSVVACHADKVRANE